MTRGIATVLALLMTLASVATTFATQTPDQSLPDDFDYFGAVPWELPDDAERMVVDAVVDGDTLRLTQPNDTWWESYRLIGIQAPEMDGPYTDVECYGPEAKAFLTALLPMGTEVYVQKDITDKDRNDRFLRHIFLVDRDAGGAMLLSEVLVLGGFAEARSYPPDDLYDDVLAEAQQIADAENDGLWGACSA